MSVLKGRVPIALALLSALLCLTALQRVSAGQTPAATTALVHLIEFREMKLLDALRLLSDQTGINIVSSSDAAKVNVSLFLRNVPVVAAIEALCKANNLWYKDDPDSGIIRIMTTQEYQRDLVSYREQQTEVFTLLYPNALTVALAIRDLYGDRVRLSLNREEGTDDTQELTSRFDRFDIVDQRGFFQNSQSGGTGTNGGGSGYGGNYGNSGVSNVGGIGVLNSTGRNTNDTGVSNIGRQNINTLRDQDELNNLTPDQLQSVQSLIAKGGTPDQANDFLDALRKKPASTYTTYVTLSRRSNSVMVRTSDKLMMDEMRKLVKRLDVPTSTVLLEVKVLSLDLGDDFNSAFDFQFSDGVNNAGGFTSGDIQPPASDLIRGNARKAASLAVGGTAVQAGDLTFQYVNKSFRTRIQLLESKNKVTTLATPMIMTANNEVSRLFVGEQRPIVRGISSQTVVNSNLSTSSPTTNFDYVPVGTTLLITPNINSDRTVTLRILQENSSIVTGGATIPVVAANGSVQQTPVDIVSTRTVSGTVVAKDDLTLAVGGLIQDSVSDQRSLIPGIGKVPVIGFFFRRQATSRSRQELIVVIRPHILSTPCEAEEISQRLLRELSIHPKAQNFDGTLDTFHPREVLEPHPPKDKKADIIQLDNVKQNE